MNVAIETLEARIAPAAGVTIFHNTASWTDYDGDHVRLTWSGDTNFLHRQDMAPVFSYFTPANAVPGGIVISEITFANAYDHITVSVTRPLRGNMGNGKVDLGYINAAGVPLSSFIAPQASVLEFDCGASTGPGAATAIGSLTLGGYGTVSPENFTTNLDPAGPAGTNGTGEFFGNVGSARILGNIEYGTLQLGINGATIGNVTVGGSLLGDANTGTNGGVLDVIGKTTSISIGKNIVGLGPVSGLNGELLLEGPVARVKIGGDIIGGSTENSGGVGISGDGMPTTVGIFQVGGSIVGGAGEDSGQIGLPFIGTLIVGRNVMGGSGDGAGEVSINAGNIIDIGGSLIGGAINTGAALNGTGLINVGEDINTINIGHNIQAGSITGGGSATFSGAITVDGALSKLTVGGDILGTTTQRVFILAQGDAPAVSGPFNAIHSISVKGDVTYGIIESGQATGATIGAAEQPDAGIGSVTIGGDYVHSSLMAGVDNGTTPGVGVGDTDSGVGILGPVVIHGSILDDPSAGGYSGFEAHVIDSIFSNGVLRFTHGGSAPVLDPNNFIMVREI